MSDYIVLRDFEDLLDDNHLYSTGDPFPRTGIEVDKERVKELSTTNNARKQIFIAFDGENPKLEMENLSAEAIQEYTKDEIKSRLDELEIEYKSNASKDELIELLKGDSDGQE